MPTIFFIFGITGDLAKTKLLPALAHLYEEKLLPEEFCIVGFGRREWDDEKFKEYIRETLKENTSFKEHPEFLDHFAYQEGQFDTLGSYRQSAQKISEIDARFGQCSNKLFYLAVPPSNYEIIFKNAAVSGLLVPCDRKDAWARILIEKPFGNDLATAKTLNLLLKDLFQEEQIFRIDHYLAKEAVQDILTFRRTNPAVESIWDSEHIEKITVSLFEERAVGQRGAFYDAVGALKDVGQNHVLQMLSLVAMELPATKDADTLREARAEVIKNLKVKKETRAQYEGYLSEPGVQKDSKTETYFRLETQLNTKRWQKTAFILQSGKSISPSEVRVDVDFREGERHSFLIQPNKKFTKGAYEKLFLDAVEGDHSLFPGAEEIEAAWQFIGDVLIKWKNIPLRTYPQKSNQAILGE